MLYKVIYRTDSGKKFYSANIFATSAEVCLRMHAQIKEFERQNINIISCQFTIFPEYEIFEKLVQKGLNKATIRQKMKISDHKYDELFRYYRGLENTRLTYSKYLKEKENGLVDYQIMVKYGIPSDEFEKFLTKHQE